MTNVFKMLKEVSRRRKIVRLHRLCCKGTAQAIRKSNLRYLDRQEPSCFGSDCKGGDVVSMEKKYITYEPPLADRSFTVTQMREVYRDLANKKEYPMFSIWFLDMIRSGVFVEM